MFIQCLTLNAQIHVHDEPLHKLVLENNFLNVIEILAKPGEKSLMHAHKNNYCYLALKGGKMLLLNEEKESREVTLPDGYTGGIFNTHEKDYIHAFQNLDSNDIKFIAVEHKTNVPNSTFALPQKFQNSISLENDFFVMLKLKIAKFTSHKHELGKPAVLLNPLLSKIYQRYGLANIKLKEWTYFNPDELLQVSSLEEEDVDLIIILVK